MADETGYESDNSTTSTDELESPPSSHSSDDSDDDDYVIPKECAMCGNANMLELKYNPYMCSSFGLFYYCESGQCYNLYIAYSSHKDISSGLPYEVRKLYPDMPSVKETDNCNYCFAKPNLECVPTADLYSRSQFKDVLHFKFQTFCKNNHCYMKYRVFIRDGVVRVPAVLYRDHIDKVIFQGFPKPDCKCLDIDVRMFGCKCNKKSPYYRTPQH
jgi:hypothetical protein